MSRRWIRFWMIWTACFVPVLWSLLYDSGPQLATGKAFAKIEKLQGDVSIQSEGQPIGVKAKVGQELYPNDIITTDAKSSVWIQFYEGRKMQLTPDSLVKLGLPTALSKDFEISVLKGRLVVKPEEPTLAPSTGNGNDGLSAKKGPDEQGQSAQLILKTPDQKVLVQPGAKELVAEKPKELFTESSTPEVSPAKKPPLDLSALALASAPICPPTPPVVEEVPPEPVAEPEVVKEIIKPTVPEYNASLSPSISPSSGEFWTADALNTISDKPMKLQIELPSKLPKDDKWTGIAQISGTSGHIRIEGKAKAPQKKLSLTLKELISSKVIPDLMRPSFAVQTGYSLESDEYVSAIQYLAPTTDVFTIRTFAEGDGIMVGFDKVQVQSDASPWLFVNPRENARIQVGVTAQEDRKKLFDLARGNGGKVSRTDWSGLPSEGAYIVRGEKIVGTVLGKDLSKAEWDKIRRVFNADMIYSGTSYAYVGRKNLDLAKLESQASKLFVFSRGQFVEIDVGLLRTRPSTLKFVQGLSSYLFREPAQILSQAR